MISFTSRCPKFNIGSVIEIHPDMQVFPWIGNRPYVTKLRIGAWF